MPRHKTGWFVLFLVSVVLIPIVPWEGPREIIMVLSGVMGTKLFD